MTLLLMIRDDLYGRRIGLTTAVLTGNFLFKTVVLARQFLDK